MSKSVTYSVVPRKNLLKKDDPAKYYAQAQASGDVDEKEMARRIEKSCTVTRADVSAVLVALEDTIAEGLQKGEIVRLGGIGTFQVGLAGKGVVKEEDFNVSQIKSAHINFRPGEALSDILPGLSYEKVNKLLVKKTSKPEEGGSDVGGGDDPTV